ncbi:histidine kinase [Flavobacterium sp. HSC-61S13]|uniref:histidine kinase n=1 Tax=Flavobacterium sp. HSC-61S13 TaxID=2910963 RepID=UPI00209D70F6|nr:histidine kinase [Flavobacterium sp. HSC-61S13]MCP1996954.1 hypothetical protein [Flavobacterium sp. HSC-61S13]
MFKITSQKPLRRRTLLLISIPILLITVGALFVLGHLITKNSEDFNKDIAKKAFYKKQKALQNEFIRLDQQLDIVHDLIQTGTTEEIKEKLNVLNNIDKNAQLVDSNWFLDYDTEAQPAYSYGDPNEIDHADILEQLNRQIKRPQKLERIISFNDSLLWVVMGQIQLESGRKRQYGFTVNLQKLHHYLSNIDESNTNYAYIFTADGTCIFHPEIEKIGKNVFDFAGISPADTVMDRTFNNPPIILSQYLKMDVIHFVSPFKTQNFEGYICVNYPKINSDELNNEVKKYTSLIFITSVSLILFVFYLFSQANKKAYRERELLAVENEKFSKEKALTQLQQLKNQINPHFLFNSLNSLYMLIDLNKKDAQNFTLHLSKIYRYLITPPVENIVPVQDELNFIQEYISLQQSRFSEELRFEIEQESDDISHACLPYLALQITVENALKHNIATLETPLLIRIIIKSDKVLVINNLQKKNTPSDSESFGLKYLQTIYQFYDCHDFKVSIENEHFICILPLIKC